MKALLVTIVLILVGDWIAKAFVIQHYDSNGQLKGFVPVTDGFGMDEIAYASTLGVTVWGGKRLLRKWIG